MEVLEHTRPVGSICIWIMSVTDDQANLKDPGPLPAEAIPPLRDLDIVEVNRCLYLDS